MMRRGIAPSALVLAMVAVGWLVTGVGALDIIRFVAYDLGFVAIPGVALLWAARGRRASALVSIAIGWPLGQTLEILAFSGSSALGLRGLFLLYPIVVIAPCSLMIWRRRHVAVTESDDGRIPVAAAWAAATALSVGLVYLTLLFLGLAPLPSATVALEYPDYTYFISLIAQVTNHWPPSTPGLVGVPLPYEWFVLFHIAAASQVTHVPIPVIGLRLDYVPTIVVVACQLLAVGRLIGRSWWTGAIAVVIIFLLGPLNLTIPSTSFGDNIFVHLYDSWTVPFGLMFLLGLLYLIIEQLRATNWRTHGALRTWALVALLMIGASGAKATILPIIIVGSGLYIALRILSRRKVSLAAVITTVLGVAIFIPTYILIYGGSTPSTTVDPLVWLARTPPVLVAQLIHSTGLRAIVLPFAYAASIAAIMAPLAGALYLLRRRHRAAISPLAYPLCLFATGLLITCVVHHVAYSELYFLDTGYVAGCFAGAEGLRLAWIDLGHSQRFSRRSALISLACWIALLIVVVRIASHHTATLHSIFLLYVGFTAAGVLYVIATALLLRPRRPFSPGVLALGLIPLLAASGLSSPSLAYPIGRILVDGQPFPVGPTVLTPGLLSALYWLRDHTSVNAVFAVNNHWIDPARTNGKYYYDTAFSERQAFVEAYNPYPILSGTATPAGANFVYRQRINDALFDHAQASALRVMTEQYSVGFLLIDRSRYYDPAVFTLGRVVFSNHDAVIVAVGNGE